MEKARILIVEDDPSFADFLSITLADLKYEVVGSTDKGEEAIVLAGKMMPDVILMDILLAGNTDGVAAAQEIVTRYDIPIIYLTAYIDEQTLYRAMISRPMGYLLKPCQASELHAAIQVALGRSTLEITERTEKPFITLLEALPYAVIACDESGIVRLLNQAARDLTGWTHIESAGKKFEDVFKVVVTTSAGSADDSLVYTAGQNEVTLLTRNGAEIPIDFESALAEFGSRKWYITLFRNVTERKRLDEALNESRRKYKGLVNSIDGIVWEVDSSGQYSFISRKSEKLLGYSPSEWGTRPSFWQDHIFPEDREIAINARSAALALKQDYESEYRMIAANGRVVWIHDIVTFFPEGSGGVKLVGVTLDITQRRKTEEEIQKAKQELEIRVGERTGELTKAYQKLVFELAERQRAEEALRRSEAKYRTLFEESQDVIFISTPDGRFVDINPAGVRLLGYESKEELMKKDIEKEFYTNPEDREKFVALMGQQGFVKDLEWSMKRKDGKTLSVLETSAAVRNERNEIIAYRGIIRDVTQLKELEEELRQAQKMEAIGQLAGGLAHDFNNLLMAIMGYCELIQIKSPSESPLLKDVAEIYKAAEGGGALIRQLLAFSRKQILETKVLDLNNLIIEIENLLQRLIGDHIQLVIELAENAVHIQADRIQVEQVLFNLAANARDAMARGGVFKITTGNEEITEAGNREFPAGQYAKLTISDTGSGMDQATLSHLFEPFFTTKEKGKGTGMGLATVYGIIKQSRGYIAVESKEGGGTKFEIYFPRVDSPELQSAHGKRRPPVVRTDKTILLVDDNELARKPFALQLEMQGFAVLEANSGEEALQMARQHRGSIDLLITDMVMPGIGGRDLHRLLSTERPGVKTLFISGYYEESSNHQVFEPGTAFLAKPASREALLAKIRELL